MNPMRHIDELVAPLVFQPTAEPMRQIAKCHEQEHLVVGGNHCWDILEMEIGENVLKHGNGCIEILRAEEHPCYRYEKEGVEYPDKIHKPSIELCKRTDFLPVLVENQAHAVKSAPHEEIPA